MVKRLVTLQCLAGAPTAGTCAPHSQLINGRRLANPRFASVRAPGLPYSTPLPRHRRQGPYLRRLPMCTSRHHLAQILPHRLPATFNSPPPKGSPPSSVRPPCSPRRASSSSITAGCIEFRAFGELGSDTRADDNLVVFSQFKASALLLDLGTAQEEWLRFNFSCCQWLKRAPRFSHLGLVSIILCSEVRRSDPTEHQVTVLEG